MVHRPSRRLVAGWMHLSRCGPAVRLPALSVPVFETRTDRLHCGLPEPAFVLRRPLVEAAERAVAEGFPPRPGVSVLGPFDWWLALCWDHNARKPRPGEVL